VKIKIDEIPITKFICPFRQILWHNMAVHVNFKHSAKMQKKLDCFQKGLEIIAAQQKEI
jgi:hypothetical protein